ncbi:mitochondrial amidoxime reducing component 2 [Folsomia candida]|uniref:mitochondrial amidoxime reducing component 2 n=1 Tax=Folsomia candida TaxID=158441 RepID=UPI000B8F9B2E|nr:mitochondrial amidoxime reducing component 2 [Folsomia candida]
MSTLDSSALKVSALCFSGGLATGIIMSKLANKLKNSDFYEKNPPEKWVKVGTISDLVIYPVKSLPGITVTQAVTTILGLQDAANPYLRDRSFVITNANGGFQTQRVIPSMALIHPTVIEDVLHLKFVGEDGDDDISVKFPKDVQYNKKLIRIWTDKVYALDCGDQISDWLSKVTGVEGLRLFYHDSENSQRKVNLGQKAFPMFAPRDTGIFQDETSYMMMTEESLTELNSKMTRQFPMKSFRPCITITGTPEPWAEDAWTFVRIGNDVEKSPIFKTSQPCLRCKMTTIDPDTGTIIEDGEPIKTLTSLKRPVWNPTVTKIVKNAAVMGIHFGIFKNENSIIQVGDPIYAALV